MMVEIKAEPRLDQSTIKLSADLSSHMICDPQRLVSFNVGKNRKTLRAKTSNSRLIQNTIFMNHL